MKFEFQCPQLKLMYYYLWLLPHCSGRGEWWDGDPWPTEGKLDMLLPKAAWRNSQLSQRQRAGEAEGQLPGQFCRERHMEQLC